MYTVACKATFVKVVKIMLFPLADGYCYKNPNWSTCRRQLTMVSPKPNNPCKAWGTSQKMDRKDCMNQDQDMFTIYVCVRETALVKSSNIVA